VELTKKLKEKYENKDILILMLTSYDQQGDEAKAMAAGCNGYLHKPIDTQALPKIIAEYLLYGHGGMGKMEPANPGKPLTTPSTGSGPEFIEGQDTK
jgi:DNA-binding response OmpR family regulator